MYNNIPGSFSIDATGSIIKCITRPDGSTHVIFLYQIVASFDGKILPVCQMISEKRDTNMICYWLREWLRTPVPCPSEVVVDYSLALLNAVSLAFNEVNLNTYVEQCMRFLENVDDVQRPKCIIRIDIAHIIKLVCRWKCFTGKHMRIKDFYIRCIGHLTKCANIDKFRQIFRDILVVCASNTEEIADEQLKNFTSQQRLIQLIKDEILHDINCDTHTNFKDEDVINNFDDKYAPKITAFLQRIQSESQPSNTGEKLNPYWCPQFGSNLLRIAKHFPLWTEIMSNSVASSACSEEYFRELKQLIFKGAKNVRVDKFLVTHIKSLSGAIKILQADNPHTTPNNSDITDVKLNTSNTVTSFSTPNITNHNDDIDGSIHLKITSDINDIKYADISTASIDMK